MHTKKSSVANGRQVVAMRHRRLRTLKQRVASGKYKVPNTSLAKALFMAW